MKKISLEKRFENFCREARDLILSLKKEISELRSEILKQNHKESAPIIPFRHSGCTLKRPESFSGIW